MTLYIPDVLDNDQNEIVYIVKAGDTLYKIAGMYGMTVNELKALNNLASDNLSIGQKLKVISSTGDIGGNTYIVKSGDSLYSIAKKFGITVDELKNANNKSSNLLSIGEMLIIPDGSTSSNIYVVKAGDTLYSIAKKYGISVSQIMEINNLTSNLLTIGQKLII